jgi:hypothetical protein
MIISSRYRNRNVPFDGIAGGGRNDRETTNGTNRKLCLRELLRGKVMELVKRGQLTIAAAAKELKVSYRQGRRIHAAYAREGDRGLSTGYGEADGLEGAGRNVGTGIRGVPGAV